MLNKINKYSLHLFLPTKYIFSIYFIHNKIKNKSNQPQFLTKSTHTINLFNLIFIRSLCHIFGLKQVKTVRVRALHQKKEISQPHKTPITKRLKKTQKLSPKNGHFTRKKTAFYSRK